MKRQIFCWTILFFAIVGLVLLWLRPRPTKTVMPPPPSTPQTEAEKAIDAIKARWMQGTGSGTHEEQLFAVWDWRTNLASRSWRAIRAVSNITERSRLAARSIETCLALPLDIYGTPDWLRGAMINNKNRLIWGFVSTLLYSDWREDVEHGWHYLIEKTRFVMDEILECDRRLVVWKKERLSSTKPKSREAIFSGNGFSLEGQRRSVETCRTDALMSLLGECWILFNAGETNRVLSVFPPEQRDEMIRQLKVLYEPFSDDEKRYLYLLPQKR